MKKQLNVEESVSFKDVQDAANYLQQCYHTLWAYVLELTQVVEDIKIVLTTMENFSKGKPRQKGESMGFRV